MDDKQMEFGWDEVTEGLGEPRESRESIALSAPDTPSLELPDHKGQTISEFNGESPLAYLTGQAGTGKTYLVRQHIQRDPSFGVLAATTGIAAINLGPGVPTIHSLLGFGNTQGAEDSYTSGWMLRKLREVAKSGARWVVVDEASMLHRKVLDNIVLALDDYNQTWSESDETLLGLMLVGDLCQLPPVPDKLIGEGGKYILSKQKKEVNEPTPWSFLAECWPRFDQNTIKLTEIRRQADQTFIAALNAARVGKGKEAVELLKAAGANFRFTLHPQFDGTTIVATNDEVDRYNQAQLLKVDGESFILKADRWCAKDYPPGEWKNIPDQSKFKVGALVMLLNNDAKGRRYVNGDLAHIKGVVRLGDGMELDGPALEPGDGLDEFGEVEIQRVQQEPKRDPQEIVAVEVELVRTGEKVFIEKIIRPTYQLNKPEMDYITPGPSKDKIRHDRVPGMQRRVWVMGELEYFPMRLAYATTVHKSQGLSLDLVQVNPSARFFGSPQMAYVALSRCRTAQGLTIVGGEKQLAEKINSDPVLARWM